MCHVTANKADRVVCVFVIAILALGIYLGHSLSTVGLTLDIGGFLLLWRFGLPSEIKPNGIVAQSHWDQVEVPDEKSRFIFAKWASHLGVCLVLIGFLLQFLGSLKTC